MLAGHWGFPEPLCYAIREHHEAIDSEDAPPLRDCIFLASYISERRQAEAAAAEEGLSINYPPPPDFVLRRFELTIEELIEQLGDLEEELERVLMLA